MKLDHPSDVCFKHSAISFGVPDMPPPDVGSSIGPISLHIAIVFRNDVDLLSGFDHAVAFAGCALDAFRGVQLLYETLLCGVVYLRLVQLAFEDGDLCPALEDIL